MDKDNISGMFKFEAVLYEWKQDLLCHVLQN